MNIEEKFKQIIFFFFRILLVYYFSTNKLNLYWTGDWTCLGMSLFLLTPSRTYLPGLVLHSSRCLCTFCICRQCSWCCAAATRTNYLFRILGRERTIWVLQYTMCASKRVRICRLDGNIPLKEYFKETTRQPRLLTTCRIEGFDRLLGTTMKMTIVNYYGYYIFLAVLTKWRYFWRQLWGI